MRPAQLLVPLTVTVVLASGCAAGGSSGPAAQPAAAVPSAAPLAPTGAPSAESFKTPSAAVTSKPSVASSAVHSSALLPVTAAVKPASWSRPDVSLKASPAAVTGAVGANQHVRVVRLANVKGRPTVTVTTAVGPQAAASAVTQAQKASGSVAVSVDHQVSALSQPQTNDTYRSQQWALTKLAAEDTWVHSRGAGVTVAVIDTGVAAVPDLAGQLLPGYDETTKSAGGNADGNGHGTHVAGIIAALANNHVGTAGIAPGVKILPVRVLSASGSGYTSDVAAGVTYAADHGAKVINMSLGGSYNDSVLAAAVAYAESKDVVVVAAAGNEKQTGNATSYPGALPGVIGVGATDVNNAIAPFSNTGSYLRIAAPGVYILSTWPTGTGYEIESGTSMASPYVAGVAALTRAAAPTLKAPAIATALYNTATDLGAKGRDDIFGAGLVNPLAAVCSVSNCASPSPSPSVTPTTTPSATPTPSAAPTAKPSATPTPTPSPAARVTTRLELTRPAASVTYGASVLLSVRLQNATTSAGLAGHHVSWCTRVGTAAATCLAQITDANGLSQVRFQPSVSSTLYVTYAGDTKSFASTSAQYAISVIPTVTVRSGHRALSVLVAPGGVKRYEVQSWNGRAWVETHLAQTNTAGSATVSGLTSGATVRVVVAATGGYLSVVTAGVKVG